jgi:fatty acid desaturase
MTPRAAFAVDPRHVEWADLVPLKRWEIVHELLLSAPWLVVSLLAANAGLYAAALACSFVFFLTGLRQVHNAFHCALGVSRRGCDLVMFALSVAMLGSMHAVRINHLRHHRHCMAEDDVEAMSARLCAWRALALGPRFPWALHAKALQVATPAERRWILAELWANAAWIVVVAWLAAPALVYHVLAMMAGQCMTAFFAVWTTHHGCDPRGPVARSIRNRFKALLTYNMFYHFEHHAFPAVPTGHLPELARRLDACHPELRLAKVY